MKSPAAAEIVRLSAVEIARLVHSRQVSAVEVTQAHLQRLQEVNPRLNAICTLSDRALAEAAAIERRLDRGEATGPLAGVPVGIKDVTETAGLRTTYGSPLYRDWIPGRDALVVSRLREAGAVILGKTNTPEFAAGGNTFNEVFGCTRNPWNLELSAGGSTGGGAAALAAGIIALAQGTDLGGSLRIPASFCGVVGLRPSVGTVPTCPSDFLWDTFQVSGPVARTATDVALMLAVLAGPTSLSPLAAPALPENFVERVAATWSGSLRLAYSRDIAGIGIDAEVGAVCHRAATGLSAEAVQVDEIELDLSFSWDGFVAARGLWMVTHHLTRLDQLEKMGANVAGNIRGGLNVSTRQLAEAEQARGRLWQIFLGLFEKYDALLTPCMAVPPFPVSENYPQTIGGRQMKTYIDWIAPTFILSLTGLPVASVPCGLDARGLPVGLQVVGRPRDELSVLQIAHHIQQSHPLGWPPL